MKRLYGLYEKIPNGSKYYYERICPKAAFYKEVAIKTFQPLLLGGALQGRSMCLRPVDK